MPRSQPVLPGKLTPKGYQQIALPDSAVALTVPGGATAAVFKLEVEGGRFRDDGTAPSETVGFLLEPTDDAYLYQGNLGAVKFIRDAASAVLNVLYYAYPNQ